MMEDKISLKDQLLEDFQKMYLYFEKIPYAATGKDNKAVGLIISQVKKVKPGLDTEGMREAVIQLFQAAFLYAPDWIRKSLTLALINSQFNVIRKHWKQFDKDKAYAEWNLKTNYNQGNKRIDSTNRTGPMDLNEAVNMFMPVKNG